MAAELCKTSLYQYFFCRDFSRVLPGYTDPRMLMSALGFDEIVFDFSRNILCHCEKAIDYLSAHSKFCDLNSNPKR
jgi:hypothetical protein